MRAHYADLPRLAHARAMAAFAPALTPMLATPPARVFAATNMLVCVLLLLLLCAERPCPLPVSQADTMCVTVRRKQGKANRRKVCPAAASCGIVLGYVMAAPVSPGALRTAFWVLR